MTAKEGVKHLRYFTPSNYAFYSVEAASGFS